MSNGRSGVISVSRATVFPLLRDIGSCPVCEAEGPRPLHVYPNSRRAVSPAINLALLGCETCGIVYSHPLPSDAELDRYYGGDEGWETRIPTTTAKVEKRIDVKRARHARHFQALEQVIGKLTPGRAPKAFDFGCGLGAWLDVLNADGWETYGLEPGTRAMEIAGRRHVMLAEIPAEREFDLVVVNHVLEHLRDPIAVLRALADATNLGGYLYVSVPDFGRLPEHQAFSYVKNERHIFSYTSASLRALFALAGVELIAHSNEPRWPGEPVDKNDAKRLKAVGRRVERELELPPAPLEEAVASLRAYEPRAAERSVEAPAQNHEPGSKSKPRPAAPRRSSHHGLGAVTKRVRRFLLVRVRAGIRARMRRLSP